MNIDSSIDIIAPVAFHSWNGERISVTLTKLAFDTQLSSQVRIQCTVKVTPDVMGTIYENQWFYLNGQTMLQDVHFEKTGDIELVLVLSSSVTAQLERLEWDIDTVLRALVEEHELALSSADLWFLIEATQIIELPEAVSAHGQLRVGFITSWKKALLDAPLQQLNNELLENELLEKGLEKGLLDRTSLDNVKHHINSREPLSTTNEASSLAQQVELLLNQRQLTYQWHSEFIIAIPVAGQLNMRWTELISIEQEASLVILYAVFPQTIPEDRRKDAAQWLMQVNYELINGAFEMDISDGELRFRTTILCPEGLQESILLQVFEDHEQIMEYYIPELNHWLAE